MVAGFASKIYSLKIYVFSTKILILEHTETHNSHKYSFLLSNFRQQECQRIWNLYNPKLCFPN